jgi:hypothetical protein
MTSDPLDYRLGFDSTLTPVYIHLPRSAFASAADEKRFLDCIEQHLPPPAPVAR